MLSLLSQLTKPTEGKILYNGLMSARWISIYTGVAMWVWFFKALTC
ncbi:MAG: hypothetical protein ACLTJG_22215 [[Clostridium] innocuum]